MNFIIKVAISLYFGTDGIHYQASTLVISLLENDLKLIANTGAPFVESEQYTEHLSKFNYLILNLTWNM